MVIKKNFSKETSVYYQSDKQVCDMLFQSVQLDVNSILETQGYIFLKDIYLLLGIQPTRQSVTAGYTKEKTGFIDFQPEYQEDGSFLLTFDVETDIRDMLPYDLIQVKTD